MNKEKLQAIGSAAHEINRSNGFNESGNYKRFVALTISELAEMLEADRKDRRSAEIIKECSCDKSSSLYGMPLSQAHYFIKKRKTFVVGFPLRLRIPWKTNLQMLSFA